MRNRFLSLFLMLTIALALAGCKPDPNVQFIQGAWYHNDAHLGSVVGEPGQETYWTFDRGAFRFSTCCFMKAEQYGHYRVVESEGAEPKTRAVQHRGTRSRHVTFAGGLSNAQDRD